MPTLIAPRPLRLRAATAADLPAVLALLAAAKLTPNGIEAQFGLQYILAVDESTNRIIGAMGIEVYRDVSSDVGLLRSAVVDEAWRGARVGTGMTVDRLAWAEREQLSALYLLTETAAEYWLRFGFARVARDSAPPPLQASHEWQQGCPASAVAMMLRLKRFP